MKLLTLQDIKAHCRIDGTEEDSQLTMYGESAEDTLAQYLNRGKTVDDMLASLRTEYGKVPTPIIHAALMLVDVSYQYRSPINPANISLVPYAYDILVKPYVIL